MSLSATRFLLPLLALVLPALALAGRTIDANPDNYRQFLTRLQAGDVLRLAPGVYLEGLPLRRLTGTEDRPIVITGPEAGGEAQFLGQDGRITVSLIDVGHLTLRHLVLDGRGARTHAVLAEQRGSFAHHVTLEHLRITGYDAAQAFNAISTKAPAWNWIIRNNVISGAGTGLYLGNSNGRAPFVAGLIEGNLIEKTIGYNMQIKHQAPRPDLPGMPTTPQQTVIRHNLFDKSGGGGTGERARPNLLLGHWPFAGPGAEDRYLVYGNLFYQNPTERLFQAEGNVAAYNNFFINLNGEAVSFQRHKDVPRTIDFHRNTVVGRGPAVSLTGADATRTQRATANLIYSELPPIGISQDDNRMAPLGSAVSDLRAPLAPRDALDLAPRKTFTGAPALPPTARALPDIDLDAQGQDRARAVFGAM